MYITAKTRTISGENEKTPDSSGGFVMERMMGVEPTYAAWEAAVLPMNYTRKER